MLRVRTLGISEILIGDHCIGPEQATTFALLLLAALRAPRPLARGELAALFWHEAPVAVRNHRLRSLLHRTRQAGAEIECTESTIRMAERPFVDFRELSMQPRSLDDVRRHVGDVGPILPGLRAVPGTPLATRLDDERDAIVATAIRWVSAALGVARSAGDWPLVEQLARAGREVDGYDEEAWTSLAEAQSLTSRTCAARTLHQYARRVTGEAAPFPTPSGRPRPSVAEQESTPDTRVVRFSVRPEHSLSPGTFVVELTARLLEEPGAAGCEPNRYAMLCRATSGAPTDTPPFGGAMVSEAFIEAFLELISALSDEATYVVSIENAQFIDARSWEFWQAVFRGTGGQRVEWLFTGHSAGERAPSFVVSRPIPRP